ncbi:glycosyltransferase [Geotalea daltonii FRC-32]|uniref:Glycosyltransferase n=1 Tax=Geotalea daltonii (strain DSM 22248 / JCM 15807 / FRC-32) TaxID=316067 RepID=B9M558_GEODF|nr:glycosyltransferase [Geotalea daltonii]ACM19813.1 glycosyltransferase [Geotalea daltonii FRC-32]
MHTNSECFYPKVSIIIPVYNGSNYLNQSIDSALAQTYQNIEVIVINDGSTDDLATENIAKSYGDRIRYFCKNNGGVGSALNFGLDKMTGKYFSWLSHDDIYQPNKIERQIELLRKQTNPEGVIVFSDWENIDENSSSIGCRIIDQAEIASSIYVVMNCTVNGCTLLIPKKCFDETASFDENLPTTQDYDLWFKMARKYQFLHLPESLVRYRIHSQQDSYKHPEHVKEQNILHTNFISRLTVDEILNLENSLPVFYIKRAIFYKYKFPVAEEHAFNLFKCTVSQINLFQILQCLRLYIKYKSL